MVQEQALSRPLGQSARFGTLVLRARGRGAGIIFLEGGGSRNSVRSGVVDINNVNEAVGWVGPDRGPDVPAAWKEITHWALTAIGDGRCMPSIITDRHQIFGHSRNAGRASARWAVKG